MAREVTEFVSPNLPLPEAIAEALAKVSPDSDASVALVFDLNWIPTMDVVDHIARELLHLDALERLTLIHPSSAMAVIAVAVATRVPSVQVDARRSVYDEAEDEHTDATASHTFFRMRSGEPIDGFVRRSVNEARTRAVRRFALVFDKDSRPNLTLADVLVEELVQSRVQEVGLIHPTIPLDSVAASLRLRLANIRIALSTERRTAKSV